MDSADFADIAAEAGVVQTLLDSPAGWVGKILPYIFGIAGIVLLFMLITSGYQMMVSKGDPKAMEMAKNRITTSIIGIVIMLFSFFIVRIIGDFFGIQIFADLFS